MARTMVRTEEVQQHRREVHAARMSPGRRAGGLYAETTAMFCPFDELSVSVPIIIIIDSLSRSPAE